MRPTLILFSLLAGGGLLGLVAGLLVGAHSAPPARAESRPTIYLPLGFKALGLADLPTAPPGPPPSTATNPPTATTGPSATSTDTPTDAPTATPTQPPTATATPTPKEPNRIVGRLEVKGTPAVSFLGEDPGPGLVLRQCRTEADCDIVARTGVKEGSMTGEFAFEDPPPLTPGSYYQLMWLNENPADSTSPFIGGAKWLGAWYGAPIRSLQPGQTLDVGTLELADLILTQPTHGTGFGGLPLTFGWAARSPEMEGTQYSWSICKECCQQLAQRVGHYHTEPLGRRTSYTLNEYPPGTQIGIEHKYCWFVRIEGKDGSHGETFHIRMLWFFLNQRLGEVLGDALTGLKWLESIGRR